MNKNSLCRPGSKSIAKRFGGRGQHGCLDELRKLNAEGITVLMVMHEEEMAAFAKTIVHFRDGLVEKIERGARSMEMPA